MLARAALMIVGCLVLTSCAHTGPTSATASASSTTSTSPSSVISTPDSTLGAGYYVNTPVGQPHWVMQVAAATGGSPGGISGTMFFVYQDGQTGLAQAFTGRVQGDVATLTLSDGGLQIATLTRGTTTTISLGSCAAYLKFMTSNADCAFHPARDVAGDVR